MLTDPQYGSVVRVEAGVEVNPQHPHVVTVGQTHHLLPGVAHHALSDDPQVVGSVETNLGAVGENDLGLCLRAVQEDDPDLTLGYLRHRVLAGLSQFKLLLDDEPEWRFIFTVKSC